MAYSIGNRELPVLQDNTSSTIGAIGDAFKAINGSFDKLANLPWLARGMVQENANARYSAALNKYSNDPDGLAKALANGNIDTSNVTANTLNQTQDRLKDIGNNYSRSYLQGRTETANNYLDKNGNQYLEAVNEAQAGHPEKLAQIRMNLGEVPWEVNEIYAGLDGQAEKDRQRSLANQAAGLAYQRNKDALALRGRQGLFNIFRNLAPLLQDPDAMGKAKTDILTSGRIDPTGSNIDVSNDIAAIVASPSSYEEFNKAMNYFSPETISKNPTALQAAAPANTGTSSEKSPNFGANKITLGYK